MKYSKSAFPYVALLLLVLIALPVVNYQTQKTQEVVVEVELKHQTERIRRIADQKKIENNEALLLIISSK